MKFLNASNKIKILALAVFAILIIVFSFLIINSKNSKDWFNDYTTKPYDENIMAIVRVTETRESEYANKTEHESAYYNAYFQITKLKKGTALSDITVYLSTTNKDNVRKSVDNSGDTTKKSVSSSGSYTTLIFNKFAVKKLNVTDNKKEKVDEEPENLFIRITYTVEENSNKTSHELKYTTKIYNSEDINYKKLDERTLSIVPGKTNTVLNDNETKEPFDLQITKTAAEKESTEKEIMKDTFKINLGVNISYLSTNGIDYNDNSNKYIPEVNINVFAKVSELADSGKMFTNYVRLASFSGALTNARQISAENSFDERYDAEEIVVVASYLLANGETKTIQYKLNLK